jgi:hypothetical protein
MGEVRSTLYLARSWEKFQMIEKRRMERRKIKGALG